MISEPRDRNKPRTKVSFRYDPLGRRISKTSQQLLQGRPSGNAVTTRFVWEGYRLLQEIHDVMETDGHRIVTAPFDGPFGRTFTFADPDGYHVTLHDRA